MELIKFIFELLIMKYRDDYALAFRILEILEGPLTKTRISSMSGRTYNSQTFKQLFQKMLSKGLIVPDDSDSRRHYRRTQLGYGYCEIFSTLEPLVQTNPSAYIPMLMLTINMTRTWTIEWNLNTNYETVRKKLSELSKAGLVNGYREERNRKAHNVKITSRGLELLENFAKLKSLLLDEQTT